MSTLTLSKTALNRLKPQALYNLVQIEAKNNPNEIIKITVNDAAYEKRFLEKVEEGLHSLKQGRHIENKDMKAWIDSWGTENELPLPQCK